MAPVLGTAKDIYAKFPSLDPPWLLAFDWHIPSWLLVVLVVAGSAALVGMGMGTVLLVRPRDRWAELAAGLATGLVAGLVLFMTTMGWLFVLSTAAAPSIQDFSLLHELSKGTEAAAPTTKSSPGDVLVKRYSDLKKYPASERFDLYFGKFYSDIFVGIPLGIWMGMVLTGVTGVLGLHQAGVAGNLLRQGRHGLNLFLPYLELVIPAIVLVLLLVNVALMPFTETFTKHETLHFRSMPSGTVLVFLLPTFCIAWLSRHGVLRGWPWPLRVGIYATWSSLMSNALSSSYRLPWYVLLSCFVAVLILLAYYHVRRIANVRHFSNQKRP